MLDTTYRIAHNSAMENPEENRFQVLSLDGGGLKGIFTASFLAEWERTTGRPAHESFDLIAGTSTGGIIALALGLGYPASDILQFYLDNGEVIFPPETFRSVGDARQAIGSRYKPDALETKLSEFFGEARLGDSYTRLVIPAYHADLGDIYIFKTSHHERLRVDYRNRVIDVARATCAAPTYFPPASLEDGLRLIDGGVWANNPVQLAVVEAMGYLERPQSDIAALRVGTTWEVRSSADYPDDPGGVGLRKVPFFTDIMMRGQMLSASGGVLHLLGDERYVDVNPTVPTGRYQLDRLSNDLVGLGQSEFRKMASDLGDKNFFNHKAAPFIPIHCNDEDPDREPRKTEAA